MVGVLVWVLAGNAVLKDIGRWMFIIGLFWLVSTLATKTVKIGHNDAARPPPSLRAAA